ncbi:carbohydrate sulfotransferase 1-like [Oratosquilla oratoria]|uniref:carbohydrate sulfotransferase 1-like n=1 Tax=Oratosquilla oratoria TaxID=337810 RepID=UPI003F76DC2F
MGRRKSVALLTLSFVLVYLGLVSISHIANLDRSQGLSSRSQEDVQYTLPSMDQVLQSVSDLDLQRVLKAYKNRHEEIPPDTPPLRLIVVSTWRSGSTLLGEVLASYPGVYYHYEPLTPYGLHQISPGVLQNEVTDLLNKILHCQYSGLDEYLKFAFVNPDLFVRNTRLWYMCGAMPRTKCYLPENLNKLCSLFPVHAMKLVRLRLEVVKDLVAADPKVKIIFLVRDPRAVMASRTRNIDWCETRECIDPGYLCADMSRDLAQYLVIKEEYPDNILLLRYEDFANDLYKKSEEILKWAGLTFHKNVKSYLDDHTTSDEEEPWSTRHDPKSRVGRWMKMIRFDEVARIQYHCRNVMKSLGYRTFSSISEMSGGNAVGLLNIP